MMELRDVRGWARPWLSTTWHGARPPVGRRRHGQWLPVRPDPPSAVYQDRNQNTLGPWLGLGMLALYGAIILVGARWLLDRRDA